MNKEHKIKYLKIGIYAFIFSIIFFIVFGVITVLIPNKFFARMTPTTALDYTFLVLTSLLLGTYVSLHRYQKKFGSKKCAAAAVSGGVGGIGGFLGFGCSVCNKVLILLLGVAGVMAYVEPYRPLIGAAGIGLMGFAVHKKSLEVKK